MAELTVPISKLPIANSSSRTIPSSPNEIWFPMVSIGQTKRINMGELISYINLQNSIADNTLKLTIAEKSGLSIDNNGAGSTVNLSLGAITYTISDEKTYTLANTANNTANFANTISLLAYRRANAGYELATTANTKISNHIDSRSEHPIATSNANGFMSSVDKQKLDNLNFTVRTNTGLTSSNTNGNYVISANSASTSQSGIVQLNDSITSTSTILAATANSVNWLNNIINSIKITEDTNIIKFGTYYVKFGIIDAASGTPEQISDNTGYVEYYTIQSPLSTGKIEPFCEMPDHYYCLMPLRLIVFS